MTERLHFGNNNRACFKPIRLVGSVLTNSCHCSTSDNGKRGLKYNCERRLFLKKCKKKHF